MEVAVLGKQQDGIFYLVVFYQFFYFTRIVGTKIFKKKERKYGKSEKEDHSGDSTLHCNSRNPGKCAVFIEQILDNFYKTAGCENKYQSARLHQISRTCKVSLYKKPEIESKRAKRSEII